MSERFRKRATWICIGLYALAEILLRGKMIGNTGLLALGVAAIGISVIYSITNKPLGKNALWGEIISDCAILGAMVYVISKMGQEI